MDETQKFRCVYQVQLEVHQLEPNGMCDGHLVPNSKLSEYGLKSIFTGKIDGNTLHDCLTKIKEKFK
jgi:hypothetical protein